MKKLLFIAMINLIMVSCEKSEPDITKSISLNKKTLTLLYNTAGVVTISVDGMDFSDVEYTVRDKFVASADKYRDEIEIRGLHVGETFLVISSGNLKDSCKITITPTDYIFEEPQSLDFGSGKEAIKAKEGKAILSEMKTLFAMR